MTHLLTSADGSAEEAASSPDTLTPSPATVQTGDAPALLRPAATHGGQIVWQYVIPISLLHLLAFLVFVPWLFSWTGAVLAFLGLYIFGDLGINLCYHRLLTHRSFKCPNWLERSLVVLALCCLQDAPGRWVATHRLHHKESDQQEDPHSPLVSFLWSHVGWLLVQNRGLHNIATYERYARDVLKKPFYMKLERRLLPIWIYFGHAALFFAAGFGIGWATGHTPMAGLQFGLSLLVWGVILRTVLVWHITWSVNSLTHLFGYRTHETGESSRNNWLVALVTNGEGWHNNHHAYPSSATNQQRWWELDLIYVTIATLEKLGLAWDVVRRGPREH